LPLNLNRPENVVNKVMRILSIAGAVTALFVASLSLPCRADLPRPEHPRPDFQRESWSNLNGEWQFEVDSKAEGEQRGWSSGRDLAQRIIVPFCPESSLSGLGLATNYMPHVWYRRHFAVPAPMRGKRLLLHFGAVDYIARLWLNGRFLGEHRGGYTPFAFEVTDGIRDGENELVVHAIDDLRSGLQPAGKQSFGKSEGCVYTRTTGIWQTVWLEAVGETCLSEFALTPDLDGGRIILQGSLDGPTKGVTLRVRAYADGRLAGEDTVPAAWHSSIAVLKLGQVVPWQPGKPFLYTLTIDTLGEGKVLDSVQSYCGLRKLTIQGNRFLINDQPVFQRLILDQGFYPDGIYTAPSDQALRRDIELSMAAGFNGARLHQKVFDPRTLYWADKLGYLVWGEFPSWGVNIENEEAVCRFVDEWRQVVRRDRNHPSIIGWCPLNETGTNQYVARLETLLAATRTMDPARPFLDSSGYTHFLPETDVFDAHDYEQNPQAFAARYAPFGATGSDPWHNNPGDPRSRYRGQPFFVSEFGGIHVKTARDTGAGWGYDGAGLSADDFLARYKGLADVLLDNPNMFGFCYTQLTDVEQEQNGIYFYDRAPKYDVARLRAINQRPAAYESHPF
jgi:beta-galactosidase/beta-glucuronidase